jgi:hypothetical protein
VQVNKAVIQCFAPEHRLNLAAQSLSPLHNYALHVVTRIQSRRNKDTQLIHETRCEKGAIDLTATFKQQALDTQFRAQRAECPIQSNGQFGARLC